MRARTGRPRGWLEDPAARRARAVKASQAAARRRLERAAAATAGLTPVEAYLRGDQNGYARAYHQLTRARRSS